MVSCTAPGEQKAESQSKLNSSDNQVMDTLIQNLRFVKVAPAKKPKVLPHIEPTVYIPGKRTFDYKEIDISSDVTIDTIHISPELLNTTTRAAQFTTVRAGIPERVKLGPATYKEGASLNIQTLSVEHGMNSHYFRSMVQSRSGHLWFATFHGGLSKYDGSYIYHYTEKEGLRDATILGLVEDDKGYIWFRSAVGIAYFDGTSFHYLENPGSGTEIYGKLQQGKDGSIWCRSATKIVRIVGDSLFEFSISSEMLDRNTPWFVNSNDNIWFVSENRLSLYIDGMLITYSFNKPGLKFTARNVFEDSRDNLWISSHEHDMVRFQHGKFYLVDPEITSIIEPHGVWCEDRHGKIWIPTWGAGAFVLHDNKITNITEDDGLCANRLWKIFQSENGDMWFCSSGGGVCKLEENSFTYLNQSNGLQGMGFPSIIQTPQLDMWISTQTKVLSKWDGHKFHYFDVGGNPRYKDVGYPVSDHSGNLWFTGRNGMTFFNGETFLHYTDKGLLGNRVHQIFVEPDSSLLIVKDTGISLLRKGIFYTLSSDSAPLNKKFGGTLRIGVGEYLTMIDDKYLFKLTFENDIGELKYLGFDDLLIRTI
ncbi:MAG: hypothetical protein IH946_07335, partial [Bacteroidetes bacterium]|nr:hypothetical protein [Bacteroidota bacterium]